MYISPYLGRKNQKQRYVAVSPGSFAVCQGCLEDIFLIQLCGFFIFFHKSLNKYAGNVVKYIRYLKFNICGLGGIGRRARLRGVWETVPVQVR